MSIDKLQGLRCKVATVDEWLSGDIQEDVVGALEQGASKVDDYLIIATSSEGTVRNGTGDTIKMELNDILEGRYFNPHTSVFWYKLDSIDEVADPSMWIKAAPNLGKTVTYETYQLDVERAEKAPAARNDILAKRFGLPMEGYTYFFTYEETLTGKKRDYWGMPCSLGADLSQGDDFCSFTFLFPLQNSTFGIKTRNYITSLTLSKLPAAMRIKYEQFISEGSLIVMDGAVLDMMQVYEDLDNHIVECGYDVRCFGYLPKQSEWEVSSRYLGLDFNTDSKSQQLIEQLDKTVDWRGLLELKHPLAAPSPVISRRDVGHILVARNADSFSFIYQEHIDILRTLGTVDFFDPEENFSLPDDTSQIRPD